MEKSLEIVLMEQSNELFKQTYLCLEKLIDTQVRQEKTITRLLKLLRIEEPK